MLINRKKKVDFLKKLEALKDDAISEVRGEENPGVRRTVPKGKRPEIIIKKENIYFNGRKLLLGDSLRAWKSALSGQPRCNRSRVVICVWEKYGVQIGTDESSDPKVRFLNLHLSLVDDDGRDLGKQSYPDGKANLDADDWQVHEVFPGYLELDGFGIDSDTKFWEIKSAIHNKTNLSCGIRDCATPVGAFGDDGELQFRLNGNRESSTIRKFSISRTFRK